MRTAIVFGLAAFLLAVGFATAGTYFRPAPLSGVDDFCFGYAICE
jgi:hypothetical protein